MIKDFATAQEIYKKIQEAQNILVVTHQNPDGDGLGALSAIAQYLQLQKKSYQLFCRDQVPTNCQFLSLLHQATIDPAIFTSQKYDLIIVLDSSDLDYAGIEEFLTKAKYPFTLINIDHHPTNTNFGHLNLVQSFSSSASEIVYDLFRLWQVPFTKEIATALLNGIIFDTGAFSNAGTTLSSLQATSHLLNLGALHQEINENILRNKSLNLLKLWGIAFERLVYNEKYQLAFTILTLKDFSNCHLEAGSIKGLTNFFNELAGTKMIMVLVEQSDGYIKGSLRTTSDKVDVGKLAQAWGGGGHKKAAGFSVKGKLVYNGGRWEIVE